MWVTADATAYPSVRILLCGRQVSDPDVGLTAQEEKRKQASNDDYTKITKVQK